MDRFIEAFEAIPDDDLMLCHEHGVAYQRDMTRSVPYNETYFDKCAGYRGQTIAKCINVARVRLVDQFLPRVEPVLDVGIGSGEFIESHANAWGHDINPKAIAWLKKKRLWAPDLTSFNAFTFWDVLEHVPDPNLYFAQMRSGSLLFTCLPIFDDLNRIRESKHYRPDEHFYYWTECGFTNWMKLHGFRLLARGTDEIAAGRDSILSFAFRLDRRNSTRG